MHLFQKPGVSLSYGKDVIVYFIINYMNLLYNLRPNFVSVSFSLSGHGACSNGVCQQKVLDVPCSISNVTCSAAHMRRRQKHSTLHFSSEQDLNFTLPRDSILIAGPVSWHRLHLCVASWKHNACLIYAFVYLFSHIDINCSHCSLQARLLDFRSNHVRFIINASSFFVYKT